MVSSFALIPWEVNSLKRITGLIVGAALSIAPLFQKPVFPTVWAKTTDTVRVKFVPITGASLQSLVHGGYGQGFILYYLSTGDISHPSLVVRIARAKGDPNTIAAIYDAPKGLNYVPVNLKSQTLVPASLKPAIFMTAIGGWWIKNNIINYNLDVEISEPIYAMWGEPSYQNLLPSNGTLFSIKTRADKKGNPLWDWRTLIPSLPGRGAYHTNYSQRESNETPTRVPSVSPLFPYVAQQGGFEQPNGKFVSPVVVDWANGRILDFSEIVTVRHQDASYDFYSISSINKEGINKPDFESPWGLYDLSSRGKGYPNLIIRTEHYGALDPWSIGIDQSFVTAPLMDYPTDELRYSWADHPGNQLFDYKIDVFGFHPYQHVQTLAGGKLKVKAPSYAEYPKWVTQNTWDSLTFVDTNGGGYETSEGIYDWTARDIGNTFWRGWTTHPDLTQFQSIQMGLRGEYEIGIPEKPSLYLSPVDGRLHLYRAQGGLWNLNGNLQLLELNLNHGNFINGWKLIQNTRVVDQLYQVDGYLVFADSRGIELQPSSLPSSVNTVYPPNDSQSWHQFSVFANKLKGRDPRKMSSWLTGSRQGLIELPGVYLDSLTHRADGLQMVIHVSREVHLTPTIERVLGLPSRSGNYVITYNKYHKTWSASGASPNRLQATVTLDDVRHKVDLNFTNTGALNEDAKLKVTIDQISYQLPPMVLNGGESFQTTLPLYPSAKPTSVTISIGPSVIYQNTFPPAVYIRPLIRSLLAMSTPNERITLQLLLLFTALLVAGAMLLAYHQYRGEHL